MTAFATLTVFHACMLSQELLHDLLGSSSPCLVRLEIQRGLLL